MELIEIRNNLIKLSYKENERPVLGQFVALTNVDKSYVAQYVNLKADNINNFAIAKLMFSFTSDGIVAEYDGSAPSIKSNILQLPAKELLDLLPVETPISIGQISGCSDIFNTDISIFEHNFTVFSENDSEKTMFISNCVRQLFRLKEKSIIVDTDSIFEDYPKIILGKDFKLPLNSEFIDYIFDYELKEVDAQTKAVIQDIFSAVQQYIKTLDDEFLSIENFIDVVTTQYKETQMPELALLKNKLLKYKEANIFANDLSEVKLLESKLKEKNCTIVNIKDIDDNLQKEVIGYIHKVIESFDKYIYYFVLLNDDNSDKKLLKRLLNNGHIFTTVLASHKYKYASELKSHAQNILLFTPRTIEHDFASYNTFLNKLNPFEGIIYGKLTQGIPLIVILEDLELDLTKEDVFGDRQRFVSAIVEDELSDGDIYAINSMQEAPDFSQFEEMPAEKKIVSPQQNEDADGANIESNLSESVEEIDDENGDIVKKKLEKDSNNNESAIVLEDHSSIEDIQKSDEVVAAVSEAPKDVLDDDSNNVSEVQEESVSDVEIDNAVEPVINPDSADSVDDLSFMDEFQTNTDSEYIVGDETDVIPDETSDYLTEDDLDFIETENQFQNEYETSSVVPVYEPEEDNEEVFEDVDYASGDRVTHPRYGEGTVEKIIKYGNKTLCSIDFDNVGRRLLDPSISDFEKV